MKLILQSKDGVAGEAEIANFEMIEDAGVIKAKGRYYVYGGMSKGNLRFNEVTLVDLDVEDDFNNDIADELGQAGLEAEIPRFDQLGAGLVKEFVDHTGGPKRNDGRGDPSKGEYNAFLADDGGDIPCD